METRIQNRIEILKLEEFKEQLGAPLDENITSLNNCIYNNCKHPAYVSCGYYKKPTFWKHYFDTDFSFHDQENVLANERRTKRHCTYRLLRCVECGDFVPIYKSSKYRHEKFVGNWNQKLTEQIPLYWEIDDPNLSEEMVDAIYHKIREAYFLASCIEEDNPLKIKKKSC